MALWKMVKGLNTPLTKYQSSEVRGPSWLQMSCRFCKYASQVRSFSRLSKVELERAEQGTNGLLQIPENFDLHNTMPTYYPIQTSSFGFLNCMFKTRSVDFVVYMKALEIEVWILLGLSLLVSWTYLQILFHIKKIAENGLLLLYSYLLEHGYHICKKLEGQRAFNIFLTIFLLMGIVLSNGYKGIVITGVTAPLQETRISTFEEVVALNYTILPTIQPVVLNVARLAGPFTRKYILETNPDHLFAFSYLSIALKNFEKLIISLNTSSPQTRLFESIRSRILTWPTRIETIFYHGMETEFLKCNNSVLVDRVDELKMIELKLNLIVNSDGSRTNRSIYMGKSSILSQGTGVTVPNTVWDQNLFTRRVGAIIESGIYNKWQEMRDLEIENVHRRMEALTGEPIRLSLDSNILTLFVICSLFILFYVVIFIQEVQSGHQVQTIFKNLGNRIRHCKLSCKIIRIRGSS